MERIDVERWLAQHPGSIHGDPDALLDRCEAETRNHAQHDAWLHAKAIAEQRLHRFERGFGLPASDTFVTREVCHEMARELKSHEPSPDQRAVEAWVGQMALEELETDARRLLRDWLQGLAEREEHAAWREIVRVTDHMARTLIRAGQMTDRCDWDLDHSYPKVAARVIRLLIDELKAHVGGHRPGSPGARAAGTTTH